MATQNQRLNTLAVGVGLRSPHYQDILTNTSIKSAWQPDFVEVHAENFFAKGGLAHQMLAEVRERFPLSLHGTGLGLGSYTGVALDHLKDLKRLNQIYQPQLISDHLAFSFVDINGRSIHSGDLLPVEFTQASLKTFEDNINRVQDTLERGILIENISAYLPNDFRLANGELLQRNQLSETEFITEICERTGCGLLVDLNNLVVNAVNQQEPNIQETVYEWLATIPPAIVGEYHLAGCSPVAPGELMIDDHSTAVTPAVWQAYEAALHLIGPRPTLLEWDTDLPSWEVLLLEAQKIREFSQQALIHEST